MKPINEFITLLRGPEPDEDDHYGYSTRSKIITEIFSQGSCGALVQILNEIYPGGKAILVNNRGHVVYKYNDRLYDINGDVTDFYKNQNCEEYQGSMNDLEDYDRYSFYDRGPGY